MVPRRAKRPDGGLPAPRQKCSWWLIAALLALGAPAQAGTDGLPLLPTKLSRQPPRPEPATRRGPAAKREEIAKRLARVQQAVDSIAARTPPGRPPDDLLLELELLKFVELVYAQQQAVEQLNAELQDRRADLDEQLRTLRTTGPAEARPYSYLLLDDLRDELAAEAARKGSLDAEIATAQALLDSLRRSHQDNESKRRRIKETLQTQRDKNAAASLSAKLELAKLHSLATGEVMRLRQAEIENNKRALDMSEVRTTLLREKIQIVAKDAVFSRQDLQTRLADLAEDEQQLKDQIAQIQTSLKAAEQHWFDARQRLEQDEARPPALVESVAAWQSARDTHQKEIVLLSQRLSELVVVRFLWECRYKVVNNQASADELRQWEKTSQGFLQRQRQAERLLEIRMGKLRMDLAKLEERLRNTGTDDAELARWIELQVSHLQRLSNVASANLVRLTTSAQFLEQVTAELSTRTEPSSSQQWLAAAGRAAKAFWYYELTSVDDRPITVHKVVSGMILLLFGLLASRTLSRLVGRRVLPRFGMDEGIASALQSIAFYVLLLTFGFVSLEWINVPLTVFAFMGGAVAIGVGFGSQNVLNNFISGLILLAERPIRVGDLVDIDGLYGTIEHVGPRSTRVKTGANLEIIVPNSKFLENNVTNWTLSDTRIRAMVSVGVAYGSQTLEVSQLLHRAVAENPRILDTPEPIILFQEFGDNALQFEAHFWIRMRTVMQRKRIESEIRHTIDGLFRAADITIAFPQRDVHIDAARPIEINLSGTNDVSTLLRPPQQAA